MLYTIIVRYCTTILYKIVQYLINIVQFSKNMYNTHNTLYNNEQYLKSCAIIYNISSNISHLAPLGQPESQDNHLPDHHPASQLCHWQ